MMIFLFIIIIFQLRIVVQFSLFVTSTFELDLCWSVDYTCNYNLMLLSTVFFCHLGASEPKNMAYMSRLGIWGLGTPFTEFSDFIQAVERR